jgi:hypothetical protein
VGETIIAADIFLEQLQHSEDIQNFGEAAELRRKQKAQMAIGDALNRKKILEQARAVQADLKAAAGAALRCGKWLGCACLVGMMGYVYARCNWAYLMLAMGFEYEPSLSTAVRRASNVIENCRSHSKVTS